MSLAAQRSRGRGTQRHTLTLSDPTSIVPRVLALLCALVGVISSPQVERGWRAGVASVDVTPTPPIRLAGYASRGTEAETIEQRLHAKALALSAGEEPPLVVVTLDSTGITSSIRGRVLAALVDLALPPERLALCVTHSHNAPMLTGTIPNMFGMPVPQDQQARIDAHTQRVVDGIAAAVRNALADLSPALVDHGRGRVGFARNRRTAGGPVDHDVPLLRVRSPKGSLRALLTLYACHCTTLGGDSNAVCGDWAGYAQADLEAAHPGCTAMVAIGCGADANPEPRGQLEHAKRHGRALAGELERLLAGPFAPLAAPLAASFEELALDFAPPPTREELLARVGQGGGVGYHARVQLARLDRGETLRRSLAVPVQSFRFGDELAIVFLGGEVVVDYSLRLRREFDRTRCWVVAYANDVSAYIPSERILREGGYEGGGAMVWYDQPTAFAPGLEDRVVQAVRTQLGGRFAPHGGIDPARTEDVPPRSPERALASFALRDDLRVELVASEPAIESPVAIDFAADGSVLVCEMRDYPSVGGTTGRITRLRDRDGDGRFETVERFLHDVTLPSGVLASGAERAFVCAGKEILLARDADGDGIAESREVVLRGFADHNEQALVNSPERLLDGSIAFACGLFGGVVGSPSGGEAIDLRGRDFRWDPRSGALEALSGTSQQGRTRDDFDEAFGCDSGTLAWHFPLPARDLARNPHHAARATRRSIAAGDDPDRLFAISTPIARYNDLHLAGRTTSACGITVLRDPLLGDEFFGDLFVCEPVANAVHRLDLVEDEGVFRGTRAPDEESREFLASTDPWFRPVQVRTGPDGALWIVDMARFLIEHPRWVPQDRLAAIDARAGERLGRIWRVVPRGRAPRAVPVLHGRPTAEVARHLTTRNGVVRDQVLEVLRTRPREEVVPALRGLDFTDAPVAAIPALLALLDSHGALEFRDVVAALLYDEPRVRSHGVRLARPRLEREPILGDVLIEFAKDPDAAVRIEVALALGDWDDERAGEALAGMLVRAAPEDTVLVDAILSSALPHLDALVTACLESEEPRRSRHLDRLLPCLVPAQAQDVARLVVATACRADAGFARADRLRIALALAPLLQADAALKVAGDDARAALADADAGAEPRAVAARLLGLLEGPGDDERLLAALADARDERVQLAALEGIAALRSDAGARVLERWNQASPALRDAIFDVLVRRRVGALAVLHRAATEPGFAASLSAARRQVLRLHDDELVRRRALEVFAAPSPRAEVIARYREVDAQPGDAERGRTRFAATCSACHLLDGVGRPIGPDLAALSDRSSSFLLDAILDPNRGVRDDYAMFVVTANDGSSRYGRIATSDATHITLVGVDGVQHVLARSELRTLANSGVSLMPEGLETQLDVAAMADLFAYLRQERRARREFDGNLPALVVAAADGALELRAASGEIYGESIVLEPQFGNLGYWHSPRDEVVWSIELAQAGRFAIELDHACAPDSAGNRFVLEAGEARVEGAIASTGGWDRYATLRAGEIDLPAGRSRVRVRPVGGLRGALMDLRSVRLVPR